MNGETGPEAARRSKPFNGYEPWIVGGAIMPEVEMNNFVRVLQITPVRRATNAGPSLYRFDILIRRPRPKGDLSFLQITLAVPRVRSDVDLLRVRRRFEMEANAFSNRSKAKQPDYERHFKKIDLDPKTWKHFFPST